jgi:hypothetical protein
VLQPESKAPFVLGTYKASWDSKHTRWQIYNSGAKKGKCGGRSTRVACHEKMQELCKDDKNSIQPLEVAAVPSRQSTRSSSAVGGALRKEKRTGNYKAGTGRGNKKAHIDPIIAAISSAKTAVMFPHSYSKSDVVGKLKQMVEVNVSMKRKLDDTERQRDALASILMDKYELGGDLASQDIKRRRTEILDEIGKGYMTEITFKRHRAHALTVIKSLCGTDLVMQRELAEGLVAHYQDPAVIQVNV